MRLLLAAALLALHPLGNFTINEYAEVHVSASAVDVAYVLDLAELPTVTEQPAAAAQAYPAAKCAELAGSLTVTADGRNLALSSRPESLTFPAGAAGLPTLRLSCAFHAPADLHPGTKITVHNGAYAGTIGWHEIVANGAVTASDVPATSVSNRLSAYPQGEQPDVRDAAFTVTADGQGALLPGRAAAGAALPDALTRQFDDLVGRRDLTLPIGALALLIAAVLGAAHAVAPGHGKTIMAAYLLGRRGQRRKAAGIAATVVATHTAGVLALGLLVAASFTFAPQALYGWLAVLNGLIVAGIGVTLWRRARRGHLHHHGHHGHGHHGHSHHGHSHHGHSHDGHDDHEHGPHGHEHAFHEPHGPVREDQDGPGHHQHQHAQPAGGAAVLVAPAPVRELAVDAGPGWRSVLAMGFAGGMTPSPSAVVVLLGAAALGRAWFGVLLVVAYGVGMGGALTGIGLILARFTDNVLHRLRRPWAAALLAKAPMVTAVLVLAGGLTATGWALLGIVRP